MRFFLAAVVVGIASAACVSVDPSVMICPGMPTESSCSSVSSAQISCVWANGRCAAAPSPCGAKADAASCLNEPLKCAWDTPGVCDPIADIQPCTFGSYGQCLINAAQVDALTTIYGNLNVSADLSAHIQANVDRMICSCLPQWFSCIANSDCGRDANFLLGWNAVCNGIFTSLLQEHPTLTTCSATWCNSVGRTASTSTFTVTFTFSAGNLPATWSQAKQDAFREALRAELVGVDSNWITFNPTTGAATVTIPAGTSLSADQLNGITATFNAWKNPSSSGAAPMFNAMGVESATVVAQPAPFTTGTTGAGARAGSAIALAGTVALAFANLL